MNNPDRESNHLQFRKKIADLPKIQLRHVLSGLNDPLENEYYHGFFTSSLGLIRITLLLSILLVSIFGILDTWIVPVTRESIWLIRFAIISPVLLINFLFTFFKFFKKIMQFSLSISLLIIGIGFSAMIAVISQTEPGFYLYYVGIIQVLIAGYTLIRLRFIYSTIVGWLLVAAYEIVTIFHHNMLSSETSIPIFLNNNFFLISTNIMGMIAGFFTEYHLRHTFLLRKRIQYEEELIVEQTKEELVQTKQELTQAHSTLQDMEMETNVELQGIAGTINNKHAAQKDINNRMSQIMTALKQAAAGLDNRVPKALEKSIELVLNGIERNVLAELFKSAPDEVTTRFKTLFPSLKARISDAFRKQHQGSITSYIARHIKDYSADAIRTFDDVVYNMNGLISYINAIIAYQRDESLAIEEHVNAALQRVYYAILNTYRKQLAEYNISFAYDNNTDMLVVLPIYDFILEEDIIRNLFLNSFRALVESDPENTRTDKKIWIDVRDKRVRGSGDFFVIHFRDNGPGIPDDKKKAIFEGYSSKKGGRGIGLRTVKKRVEEIGGKISEGGTPGEGVDFMITIAKRVEKKPAAMLDEIAAADELEPI